jgi:hypothetical protein
MFSRIRDRIAKLEEQILPKRRVFMMAGTKVASFSSWKATNSQSNSSLQDLA